MGRWYPYPDTELIMLNALRSLRTRFENASLQRKIALTMGVGGLLVTAAIAIAAFMLSRQLIVTNTRSILAMSAQQQEREVVLRMESAIALARSLANNTVTANALADNLGRMTYLAPLLSSQSLPFPGAKLLLTDYRGRVVAASSSDEAGPVEGLSDLVDATLTSGNPGGALLGSSSDKSFRLVAVFPVVYRLTGQAEGAIVLIIPAGELMQIHPGKYQFGLLDGDSKLITGSLGGESAIRSIVHIDFPQPLGAVFLSVSISQDRDVALHELDTLFVVFVVIGAVLLIGVTVISRRAARFLTQPLSELSFAAERISQSGRPESIPEMRRDDELGSLARAFHQMLGRLTDSYDVLERRVEERTAALQASEQKLASILASIQDGIWSLTPDGRQLSYISPSSTSVTGIDSAIVQGDLSVFFAAVHANDIEVVQSALRRLIDDGENIDIEFRFNNPQKGLRTLQARAHRVVGDDGSVIRLDGMLSDVTQRSEAEEQLRRRELYLRAILDNFPFMVWLKDADSRFLAVNQRFAEAAGRSTSDELRGLTDLDAWPASLAEQYRADDREVMASGQEKNLEEPVEIAGARRWIETFKKPVVTPEGQILGTVGFARDITERKEMQYQLAKSEERWELAVAGSNDGIWDWDIRSGTLYLSERWKEMLGYRDDEISNRYEEWEERIHPEDRERVLGEVQRHLDGNTDLYQVEHRVRCKDGSYRWILARGKAIRDSEGRPSRFLGSHSDIHERILAESGLKLRTAQLNAIFALSPDGFIAFGENGLIEYASTAFCVLTGLDGNDVYGLGERELLGLLALRCLSDSRSNLKVLESLEQGNGKVSGEGPGGRHVLELDKPERRVLEIGRRQSAERSVSKIFYFRDVTYETEVDRLKSEFLSTAAHELRTPMVSILGFSELLLEDSGFDKETTHELIDTIHRQSTLMASIIDELLDLARIEARRGQDFVLEALDLCQLARDVAKSFRFPNDSRGITLHLDVAQADIEGDRRKVTQAINNVVTNAFKYSPDGGEIVLTVRHADMPSGQGYEVSVTDQGVGMTPESVARVCERFFRADTSGRILGTGLGMSIVKEIVDLHGGTVGISSELNQGTEVVLGFPANHAQSNSLAALSEMVGT